MNQICALSSKYANRWMLHHEKQKMSLIFSQRRLLYQCVLHWNEKQCQHDSISSLMSLESFLGKHLRFIYYSGLYLNSDQYHKRMQYQIEIIWSNFLSVELEVKYSNDETIASHKRTGTGSCARTRAHTLITNVSMISSTHIYFGPSFSHYWLCTTYILYTQSTENFIYFLQSLFDCIL